nr:hypothetical protein [Tanacetum cinerariifolium]
MELYMMNRQHGRMILESVQNGLLIWPTIEENVVTRPRKYSELTLAEAIQADCDVKATNIILQGLPPEVYALVRNSSNPRQQATINDGRVTLQPVQGRQISFATSTTRTYTPGASGSNSRKQRTVICYNYKREGHMSKQCTKPRKKRNDYWFKNKVLLVQAQENGQILHEEELAFLADPGITKVALMANLSYYGSDALAEKAQQLEPKLYDSNVIKNTCAIVILDSEETLMLAKESRLKMLLKQHDPMVLEKKVNTTPVDYAVLNQLSQDFEKRFVSQTELSAKQAFWSQNFVNSLDPSPSCRPIKVKVPKELPKVSMDKLRKLKGKALVDNAVTTHTIAPKMLKFDMEPLVPKVLNNRTVHSDYLRHTLEQAAILREVVEQEKSQNRLNNSLDHASSSSNLVSNNPMLSSTGVKPSTSLQPSGNTKKDRIQRPPSSTQKNKVEAHHRTVKSSLKNKNYVVEPKGTANVQHCKLNANYELICVKCNGYMLSDNHDLKPTVLENDTPKPIVTLTYSRKPRKSKTNVSVSKPKTIKSISANNKEPNKYWGSVVSDVPSSSLDEFRLSKWFSGIWTLAAPSI